MVPDTARSTGKRLLRVSRRCGDRARILLDGVVCRGGASMVIAFENAATSSEYAEIARRPLQPEQCALVVIDIQEKLLPPIFQKEQLVRNAQLLIWAAGILKIPALVSTQYVKGLGQTVPQISSLPPGTEPVDKMLFSCFGSDL